MFEYDIIDTFPAFLAFWSEAQHKPIDEQMEGWASEYMSRWPGLLEKQLQDYSSQNVDWRQIAREKIFPFLGDRLPVMKVAHKNLLESCGSVYSKTQQVLMFQSDVIFVIYVGIGCGAGWGTSFHNLPAILFGLEKIAECGWLEPPAIDGLIAHEIGHLVHFHWREKEGRKSGNGPFWQLYTEGFAQRCEHVILGKETWHECSRSNDKDWLSWCHEHKSWLAQEFLRFVEDGKSVSAFFGDWYEIKGRKQCGYFLGHELVKELQENISLKQIALLDDIEGRFRCILEKFARYGT